MPANKKPPNFILINCDDLGYGDLGCYGSYLHKTPHIDRLAAEGLRFTDFYMASPICSPSRGAMMTGCYPPRIGFDEFDGRGVLFPGQGVGMNSNEITVARILSDLGYATKIIGKWHCGDQPPFLPTRHGFDSYFGLPYSNDMGRQEGGRTEYPPLPLLLDEEVVEEQPDQASLTFRYTDEAIRFLKANGDTPFFLYFAHMHVHLPHYVPRAFRLRSQNGPYGAAVEYIDWSVGAILEAIRKLGLDDNTLVMFTSDNGSNTRFGGSNLPLRGRKGTTWEGGIRVPCLARFPGRIPSGTECGEIATALDVLPTFTSLAGGSAPDDRIIDGKDITPLLTGEPGAVSPHDRFYYYLMSNLEAVRSGKWKLAVSRKGETIAELYDLEADIGEANDISRDRPDVVDRLQRIADEARDDLGDGHSKTAGKNRRAAGRVGDPVPLTEYNPDHPYVMAMYDLPDVG